MMMRLHDCALFSELGLEFKGSIKLVFHFIEIVSALYHFRIMMMTFSCSTPAPERMHSSRPEFISAACELAVMQRS